MEIFFAFDLWDILDSLKFNMLDIWQDQKKCCLINIDKGKINQAKSHLSIQVSSST